MSKHTRGAFASGAIVGLVVGLSIAAIAATLLDLPFDADDPDPVAEALQTIEDNYFEEVDPQTLEEASIDGMVRELRRAHEDRFSHYFTPRELRHFHAATSGEFDGVGLTVSEVPRGLRVARVLPDSPAEAAGIKEGDRIVAVDGKSIAGLSDEVSAARIKGKPGTTVELRILPAEGGPPRDIEVERASVRLPAVEGEIRRHGGRKLAYVRFYTFSEGAHGELRDEVERLYRRGAEGLLLDLRGNGGGLLNEAVLSSSVFVDDGVIVSTRSRTQGDRTYDAVGDAIEPRPMVVLVNRDTASASEILAAAVEAHDLATVVGSRTYGKGTFQEVIPLDNGGALDLTIGEYLTAEGESLLGRGVRPGERAVDDPETESRDEGLERALEVLSDKV